MKDKYIRLKSLLLAGAIFLGGTSLTGCSSSKPYSEIAPEVLEEVDTKHFGVGEHVISLPISSGTDIRRSNCQYEYHEGYEVVGIDVTAYGTYANTYGGGAILYANNQDVEVRPSGFSSTGEYVYTEFATPAADYSSQESIREFGIGEHIISIPLGKQNDIRDDILQLKYYEGYEIVGIASSAYGTYANTYGGGVILYTNTVPVRCALCEGGYTSFGTPIEKELKKELK